MVRSLLILGTGGGVHDVLDAVAAINDERPTWEIGGFLDDARAVGSEHLGLPIRGRLADAARFTNSYFINAIGSDRTYTRRGSLILGTNAGADRFATLVHPGASVSRRARLGFGVLVSFGASVGGGVTIGDHVTLCPNAIIGHDSLIDPYTLVAPGAIVSGHVRLGESCYIGAGAMIRQGLSIGARALVGMGSVVTRDVEAECVVWGSPARDRAAVSSRSELG